MEAQSGNEGLLDSPLDAADFAGSKAEVLEIWQPAGAILAGTVRRHLRRFTAWSSAQIGMWRLIWASKYARLDPNAKCPGCGWKQGHLKTIPEARQMGHVCHVCGAEWGEPFLMHPDLWLGKK